MTDALVGAAMEATVARPAAITKEVFMAVLRSTVVDLAQKFGVGAKMSETKVIAKNGVVWCVRVGRRGVLLSDGRCARPGQMLHISNHLPDAHRPAFPFFSRRSGCGAMNAWPLTIVRTNLSMVQVQYLCGPYSAVVQVGALLRSHSRSFIDVSLVCFIKVHPHTVLRQVGRDKHQHCTLHIPVEE